MNQTTELQRNTLYSIRTEHLQLIEMIEEADGELTPEIETALQLNEEQFNEKAVSYGFVVKGFEDRTAAIDNEINRLCILRDKSEKRKELFKNILSEAMKQYKVEKIETPLLKLSFRKSEAVNITDENKVPIEFTEVKEEVTVDKIAIKKAFKAGREIEGAELCIKQNLQIR